VVLVVLIDSTASAARRGDADGSGATDMSDAIFILRYVFSDGSVPALERGDVNHDGFIDMSDAIFLLRYLFRGRIVIPADDEVPISLWTHRDFPTGLPLEATAGFSFGDYDQDGYIDMFNLLSGNLWHNLSGETWELAKNLLSLMPAAESRYGSSFGDYNNDGFPDIAIEPRNAPSGDTCFHLLMNDESMEGREFTLVDDTLIDGPHCGLSSETICWGDVDFDGWLDMFLPVYPFTNPFDPPNSHNTFLHNLGPTSTGGPVRFEESGLASGLGNLETERPEGAQFVDVDFDGDLDLYSNGIVYQNRSAHKIPTFYAMPETASGVGHSGSLDEGARFFDYDADGDYDLVVAYIDLSLGIWIWKNRGDGTFQAEDQSIIEQPFDGLDLGMSAADWDNDGDIDFTTREVFRKNTLSETGEPGFTVATHSIPSAHLQQLLPAWGDWDKDGDVDCILANWSLGFSASSVNFYSNGLYTVRTLESMRTDFHVKPVNDSTTVDRGLETEYGASIELASPSSRASGHRYRKFTSSSAGYLNQDEYTLTFGLPVELQEPFDVVADFPSDPTLGHTRVDRHVNPFLGNISPEQLGTREVVVYRSGRVRFGGADFFVSPAVPRLETILGGHLIGPTPSRDLPTLSTTLDDDWFVGLAFQTGNGAMRITEIIVDGHLHPPKDAASFNLALWDVTHGTLVDTLAAPASDDNDRQRIRTDLVALPFRTYKLVAHVKAYRPTDFSGPRTQGVVETRGGMLFQNANPQDFASIDATGVDSTHLYLTCHARPALLGSTIDLGTGRFDPAPHLTGSGDLASGTTFELSLEGAAPNAPLVLVSATSPHNLKDQKSGPLPLPPSTVTADSAGRYEVSIPWPNDLPPGNAVFVQVFTGVDEPSNILWLTAQ